MSDIITEFTLDSLRDAFQGAGYRVETVAGAAANAVCLRSATAGLTFDIRPGMALAGADQAFVDVTLVAPLQVQGELPLDIVNRWNASRRFARLSLSPPFLVLCFDICVAGGVAVDNLRSQIGIWDRLIQDLTGYLRDEVARLGAAGTADAPPAGAAAATLPAASVQ